MALLITKIDDLIDDLIDHLIDKKVLNAIKIKATETQYNVR